MSQLRKGLSEDSPNRSLKPNRPPPPRVNNKDAEAPPTANAPARPQAMPTAPPPQSIYQATPTAPPPQPIYQATPSAPPLQPYDQTAVIPPSQQSYYQGPVQYQPQQGPYMSIPPGAMYQAPPPGASYQAPPPGASYQAPPPGASYQAPPPGASYQAPPPGASYQAPPPGVSYQAPPQGALYQAPPPGASYYTPPPGASYQAPPPYVYQDTPPYQGAPGMSLYQTSPPNGAPRHPSISLYPTVPNGAPRGQPIPPLQMHEVRWFHTKNGKFWQPFCGGDSLKLEARYQSNLLTDPSSCVEVMGDLYEANLQTKMCRAIYWSDPLELFRNNFVDPKKVNMCEISTQLFSAGLISKEEKEEADNSKGPPQEDRSAKLLLVIERIIKDDATNTKFDQFIGILDKVSKYQEVVRKIKGDHFTVMRGTWFEVQGDKWYPFEEEEAWSIEKNHCGPELQEKVRNDAILRQAADERLKSLGKPQQQTISVVDRLALEKCEVIWMSNGETWKQKKDISTMVVAKLGEIINKPESFGGVSIKRGYKEHALQEDQLPPIGHLVFVIHGIGQNMDSSDITKSASDFRETCTQVAKKSFSEKWKEKRVEFIPLDWRTSLTLDDGMLTNITLHSVKGLRDIVNDSVLDIFFYTSPKYGPEILKGLHTVIQIQYRQFIRRHPHFHKMGGAVSIFAHSLGSVMTFDLLHETSLANRIIHDNPPPRLPRPVSIDMGGGVKYVQNAQLVTEKTGEESSPVLDPGVKGGAEQREEHLKLDFNVDHFFAVGSPLGVFILMREHESLVKRGHRSSASLVPAEVCRRIHNLHHPSDPVAYRLEPLVNEAYANIRPVKIDSAGSKPSKTALDHAEGPKSDQMLAAPSGQSGSWMSSLINAVTNPKKQAPESKQDKDKLFENDIHLLPADRLKERIDFSLKEGLVDISYVNTLTAHTGYWTSADCALYVLLQIYNYQGTPSNL